MELERAAFLRDKERQQRIEEKREQRNQTNGQALTKQERAARIWAFMYVDQNIASAQYPELSPLGIINQRNRIWKMTRTIPMMKILRIGLKTIKMMDARDKTSSSQTRWTILISSVLMPVGSSIAPSTSLATKINTYDVLYL